MRTPRSLLVLLVTGGCAVVATSPAAAAAPRLLGLPALPGVPSTGTPLDGLVTTITGTTGTIIGTVTGGSTQVTDPTGTVIGTLDPVTGIVTGSGGQVIGTAGGSTGTIGAGGPPGAGETSGSGSGTSGASANGTGDTKVPDTRAPGLRLTSLASLTYTQVRTKGVRVTTTCDELCATVVYLTTGTGRTAKLVGAGVAVGLPAGYAGTFRVKLFPKAMAALSKTTPTTIDVLAAATDAAGNDSPAITSSSLVTVPAKKAKTTKAKTRA